MKCAYPQIKDLEKVQVVRRRDIPSLHVVIQGDGAHNLGILKDFRESKELARFIPDNSRLAMSWVRLQSGEVLDSHRHPISSMILICQGQAKSLGDLETMLTAGDALLVPPTCEHGFIGAGQDGFWGLSIQFEQRGLYEEPSQALVEFSSGKKPRLSIEKAKADTLESLKKLNLEAQERFSENSLFDLADSGYLKNENNRKRFLGLFQCWSDAFQKMVLTRAAFTHLPDYRVVAEAHLQEEVGHNVQLRKSHSQASVWDAELDALSNWFPSKMLSSSDAEKLLIVHWVVERSANVFYKKMAGIFDPSTARGHFNLHLELDGGALSHADIGAELLECLSPKEYQRLAEVHDQAWIVLGQMFSRVATLLTLND